MKRIIKIEDGWIQIDDELDIDENVFALKDNSIHQVSFLMQENGSRIIAATNNIIERYKIQNIKTIDVDESNSDCIFNSEDLINFHKWLNINDWRNYSFIREGLWTNLFGVQKDWVELVDMYKNDRQPKIILENEYKIIIKPVKT